MRPHADYQRLLMAIDALEKRGHEVAADVSSLRPYRVDGVPVGEEQLREMARSYWRAREAGRR